jgi:hypothetical protein
VESTGSDTPAGKVIGSSEPITTLEWTAPPALHVVHPAGGQVPLAQVALVHAPLVHAPLVQVPVEQVEQLLASQEVHTWEAHSHECFGCRVNHPFILVNMPCFFGLHAVHAPSSQVHDWQAAW